MGNTFFPNDHSTETDTWTTGGQQRTYKKQHKSDNTIVRNKTQIVLGYQLKYS